MLLWTARSAEQAPGEAPGCPRVAARIDHYNHRRLHSAIGYVTPHDKLAGLETEIWAERDRKLEQARGLRRKHRELDHAGIAAYALNPSLQPSNLRSTTHPPISFPRANTSR